MFFADAVNKCEQQFVTDTKSLTSLRFHFMFI